MLFQMFQHAVYLDDVCVRVYECAFVDALWSLLNPCSLGSNYRGDLLAAFSH